MSDILSTPPSTDLAYGWLQALFPLSGDSPYAGAMAVFAGSLTFFASLLLAWHVLSGIVVSAYHGKVLGQRYHQIWAPLRVILGFGMLVPVSGGFSSIHWALRDIVGVAAINIANAPVKYYIQKATSAPEESDNPNAPLKLTTITVASNEGRVIYDAFLKKGICYAVDYGENKEKWSFFSIPFLSSPGSYQGGASEGEDKSTKNKLLWDFGTCGSVSFPAQTAFVNVGATPEEVASFNAARAEEVQKIATSVQTSVTASRLSSYFTNHDIKALTSERILQDLISQGYLPSDLAAKKEAVVRAYNERMSNEANKLYKTLLTRVRDDMVGRLDKYGFMVAGSFERGLSKVSAAAIMAANSKPLVTEPSLDPQIDGTYRAAVVAVLGGSAVNDDTEGQMTLGSSSKDSALDVAMSWISPAIHDMKLGTESTSGDPLGDMISFGHNLLVIWQSGMAAMLALRELAVFMDAAAGASLQAVSNSAANFFSGAGLLGAGLVGILAVLKDSIMIAWGWITPVFTVILLVGVLHAFVLPMIPMMMVFVMGVSWLIMFLEASIAALLWAFVFVRMDGEDFVDRAQAQGASLLFNLLLRPVISMLAFLGSLILLPKLMNSLTVVWDQSFQAQTTMDYFGFIQWTVGVVVYTWMQWHLTLRMFGLIPTIADRVGSWMGMNAHGYNDGSETSQVVGGMMAAGTAVHQFSPRVDKKRDGDTALAGVQRSS